MRTFEEDAHVYMRRVGRVLARRVATILMQWAVRVVVMNRERFAELADR